MKLTQLVNKAKDKNNFVDLIAFIAFCDEYLNYITDNLQATIIGSRKTKTEVLTANYQTEFEFAK